MTDYIYAMYSYLLDIDLYFNGRDTEATSIVKELKKAIDNYVKSPDKTTFQAIEDANNKFFSNGELKPKFCRVSDYINNLGEMIYMTKQAIYKFK